jgi:hypothetical protein
MQTIAARADFTRACGRFASKAKARARQWLGARMPSLNGWTKPLHRRENPIVFKAGKQAASPTLKTPFGRIQRLA